MKKKKELSQQENIEEAKENEKELNQDALVPEAITEELQEEPKKKQKKQKKEKALEEVVEDKKDKKDKKVKKEKKAKKPKKIKNRSRWTQKYFNKFSGRAKDSFMKFIKEDYNMAVIRAERLSSINRNAYDKPIMISIPDSFSNSSKVSYRLDKNPDGTFTQIYDQALLTILFFGKETLFYYQANIDHRNGHIGYDTAGEFNYFDVVHMETQLKYDHPDKPKYLMLDLEVGLSDGRMVPFHLRNHRMHEDYILPEILTQTEQQILDMFKSKVRKEKSI